MERANEFMKAYEKFKSDFMKKHLSGISSDSDFEMSSPSESASESDECSVDSIPVESLFKEDSSDDERMIVSKHYFYSSDAAMAMKPISSKMMEEREQKRRMEEEEEFEKSLPHQSFKYWKPFIDIAPKRSSDSLDVSIFYRNLYDKWLPKLNLIRKDVVYHYMLRAGSKTNNHLIPSQLMGMILSQHLFPYEWQMLLREMFPKTYNPHTRQINVDLYYRYVDEMIKKYDEEEESEETFVKKYVLLNSLLTVYLYREKIWYFANRPDADIRKDLSVEETNEVYLQNGANYDLLFCLGLWISESYENEIFPSMTDIYQMTIYMTTLQSKV